MSTSRPPLSLASLCERSGSTPQRRLQRAAVFCGILFAIVALASGCIRPADGPVTLQYAAWGSAETLLTERAMIAAFERRHPNIKVELLGIGSRYESKLQTMMVGGVPPDVLLVEMSFYHDWAHRGVLRDLSSLVDELETEDEILPVPRRAFSINGRFHAVPITTQGFATFINLDALEAAGLVLPEEGLTWDWLERNARAIARKTGNPNAPVDYVTSMTDPLIYLWSHGGGIVDNMSEPRRILSDTPENRAGLACMQRLLATGGVLPLAAVLDPNNPQYALQLFREQKTLLHFAGSWVIPSFAPQVSFRWTVLPMPAGPSGSVTLHGGSGLAVHVDTPHREAADAFVRFYFSPEGLEILVRGGGIIPAWRSAAYGETLRSLPPVGLLTMFSQTMEDGGSRGRIYAPGTHHLRQIVRDYLDSPAAQLDRSPSDILQTFGNEAERWLTRQQKRGLIPP